MAVNMYLIHIYKEASMYQKNQMNIVQQSRPQHGAPFRTIFWHLVEGVQTSIVLLLIYLLVNVLLYIYYIFLKMVLDLVTMLHLLQYFFLFLYKHQVLDLLGGLLIQQICHQFYQSILIFSLDLGIFYIVEDFCQTLTLIIFILDFFENFQVFLEFIYRFQLKSSVYQLAIQDLSFLLQI